MSQINNNLLEDFVEFVNEFYDLFVALTNIGSNWGRKCGACYHYDDKSVTTFVFYPTLAKVGESLEICMLVKEDMDFPKLPLTYKPPERGVSNNQVGAVRRQIRKKDYLSWSQVKVVSTLLGKYVVWKAKFEAPLLDGDLIFKLIPDGVHAKDKVIFGIKIEKSK